MNRKPVARTKKKQAAMDKLHRQVQAQMREERIFWDDMVRIVAGEEMSPDHVQQVLDVADRLTEARRQRYPLEEK